MLKWRGLTKAWPASPTLKFLQAIEGPDPMPGLFYLTKSKIIRGANR